MNLFTSIQITQDLKISIRVKNTGTVENMQINPHKNTHELQKKAFTRLKKFVCCLSIFSQIFYHPFIIFTLSHSCSKAFNRRNKETSITNGCRSKIWNCVWKLRLSTECNHNLVQRKKAAKKNEGKFSWKLNKIIVIISLNRL